MTTAPTAGVGWTLARLAALNPRRTTRNGSDSAGASREQIADLLRTTDAPMLIEDLCSATGLHANTIRGHLDVLVASGEVSRSRAPAQGRGRPPWLYSAAEREHSMVDDLRAMLDAQLAVQDATDEAFVADAAERWAEAMGPDFSPRTVSTPSEAVEAATEALDAVGFAAQVSPLGDSIALRACPYASLVADHPVICDIHTALLTDLLHRTGQGVEVEQMQVWATPSACLVRLRRPDMTPERVITPPDPAPATSSDKPRRTKRKKKQK
jgi:predicted ArsR family transcriptional regulator